MISLNEQLKYQLKDIRKGDKTVTEQEKNKMNLNLKLDIVNNKIDERNKNIQQTFEEIKSTENWIYNIKECIKQTDNSITELNIESALKERKIQELLNQLAKANFKPKTPIKQKKKFRSTLKWGRNTQSKTVSTMTPSASESTNHKKLVIKRLEMSKLKNSATVETEISTPNSHHVALNSPKYHSNNYQSFQSSEYQGSVYGKTWEQASSRNSMLGIRKSSHKVIVNSNNDKLLEEKKWSNEVKKRITGNQRKSKIDEEITKILKSVIIWLFSKGFL